MFRLRMNVARFLVSLAERLTGSKEVRLEDMPDCPSIFHTYRSLLSSGHQRVPGGWVYEGEFYPDYLTVGGNSFAIRRKASEYCRGSGIDIGASYWPFPGSVPVDKFVGDGRKINIDSILPASQDYVFSSHCLEHIADWEASLDCWVSKLRIGGVLFLYLPHPSCKLWHRSNPQMRDNHKWVPTPEIIRSKIIERGLAVLENDDGPDHFYSFFIAAKRRE